MEKTKPVFKGLYKQPVYLIDTSETSPALFNIKEFPTQLNAGRNIFKIHGHYNNLRDFSPLYIEVLDYNNNPIYYEVADEEDEDGSVVIIIYIYETTPAGKCTITLIGEAAYIDDVEVPREWQHQSNIMWQKTVFVNPKKQNTGPIIFGKKPTVQIQEQVGVQLDRIYDTTQFITYDTGSVQYISQNKQPVLIISGGVFVPDMIGGIVTINTPVNPYPVSTYITGSIPYSVRIAKVLSSSSILLQNEYFIDASHSIYGHRYDTFDRSSYTIKYEATPLYVPTENSESYALIEIDDLQPKHGDISRIKVFSNNSGTVGNWDLLSDVVLGETEIFVTSTASIEPYMPIGLIKSSSIINTYYESASFNGFINATIPSVIYSTTNLPNSLYINSQRDISAKNNVDILKIKDQYSGKFIKDAIYKFRLDAIGTRTNATGNSDPIISFYVSGSAFDTDYTDYFNQELPITVGKRIGYLQCKKNKERFDDYTITFTANNTGTGILYYVIEGGQWQLADIHVTTNNDPGYTPNYTRIRTKIPTNHKSGVQQSFKIEYYNSEGVKSEHSTISDPIEWKGGNHYIDGDHNLITGSIFVADKLSTGIEFSGRRHSGYIRTVGYTGFNAKNKGILIWSGSALSGSTDDYKGTGIELYESDDNYFRFATDTSETRSLYVKTKTFFLGNPTSSISADGGNIHISGSIIFDNIIVPTASYAFTASYYNETDPTFTRLSGSLATTGSNNFSGSQTIYGNLTVIGTASFVTVTGSSVNTGNNLITLNTNNPSIRFGGMQVVDTGSFGSESTGSMLWDSQKNRWIYSNPSGSSYDGGLIMSGPRNTSGVGNEVGVLNNFLTVGQGEDHVSSSAIFHSGSITQVTGSLLITNGITGSLLGTASWANNSITASYFFTSSVASSSYSTTSSHVLNAPTLDRVLTAGNTASNFIDFERTKGIREIGGTGSYLTFLATRTLWATGDGYLNSAGINLYKDGHVRIASSNGIDGCELNIHDSGTYYSSGVSQDGIQYGADYSLTYTTRSLVDKGYVDNRIAITTASFATNAITASYVLNAISSSYSTNSATASYISGTVISSSYAISSSYSNIANTSSYSHLAKTSSYTVSSSYALNAQTASYVLNAVSSSYTNFASTASYVLSSISSSFASTASYILNAVSASYSVSSSFATNSTTASYVILAQTASYVTLAQTASYVVTAQTASYVLNSISSSYAQTASYVLNSVTASYSITASHVPNTFILGGNSFNTPAILGTNDNQSLRFETNNAVRMQISSSGQIVYGGTNALILSGGLFQGVSPFMEIQTGETVSSYNEAVVIRHNGEQDSAVTRSLSLLMKLSSEQMVGSNPRAGKMGGMLLRSINAYADQPDLHFVIGNAEKMTITYTGNVGIGTTTPNAKLDVNGNVIITGSLSNGNTNQAIGTNSHAEGELTNAFGPVSHAEGAGAFSPGIAAHAEGYYTTASGQTAHAEGTYTKAIGNSSHTEGYFTVANFDYAHAEGARTIASSTASHSEGYLTTASGDYSHAEGQNTIASGQSAHAEGHETRAVGIASHAEGYYTTASGDYSHAEGMFLVDGGDIVLLIASGIASHAEGMGTNASGTGSHAEGQLTYAKGDAAHSEGLQTIASSSYSHAEGYYAKAYGDASHAEGYNTTASGSYSHSEGFNTTARGNASHAEGIGTFAIGDYSHAEGSGTIALGDGSHAAGWETVASGSYQSVIGQFNISSSAQSAFIIGNGNYGTRSNLVFASGSSFQITGSLQVSGSIIASSITTTDALIASTTLTANTGITTIYIIPTASYDGAWFDYTIRSGSNARAGTIFGLWSGSAVKYAETTTTDFGSTANFTFGMSISSSYMILSSSTTTNGWTVNTIVRSI